jgi:hypothetical protein
MHRSVSVYPMVYLKQWWPPDLRHKDETLAKTLGVHAVLAWTLL